LVHLDDYAGDGRDYFGGGLDGFNGAEGVAGGEDGAGRGELDKYNVPEGGGCVCGDADGG